MNAKLKKVKKVSVLVCCVSLLFGAVAVGGAAKGETSILERITATTDWELGELIRQALEKSPELNDEAAQAALARRVTDAYVQIKLLDEQIKATNKKIESQRTTEVIRAELILARKELQTNLELQVAELREILKIVPEAKYERPVNVLNTWLAFDVIGDDSVCVYKYSKPYYEPDEKGAWDKAECRPVKVISGAEAIEYVTDLIKDKEHHPLRLDIFRTIDGRKVAEELKIQIDQIVEDAKLEMNPVEVFLDAYTRRNVRVYECVLREGTRAYWRNKPEVGGTPEAFFPFFTDICLERPQQLPLSVYIEFDEESRDVASKYSYDIGQAASELGVRQFVNIALLSGSFGQRKPVEKLNSWLVLDVIGDDSVRLFKGRKPYREWSDTGTRPYEEPVKLMSEEGAIGYVKDLIQTKDKLPFRVNIYRTEAGSKLSEELHKQIVQMVKDAKVDVEAEVYLDGEIPRGSMYVPLVLKQGKVYNRSDGSKFYGGSDTPADHIIYNVVQPGCLPLQLDMEFDHESKDLATKMLEGVREAARELGLEQFVTVEAKASEDVNSWLALDVIADDTVRVFKYSKPYGLPLHLQNPTECHLVKSMSQAEATEYVRDFIKDKDKLPLMVDIHRTEAGSENSELLYKHLKGISNEVQAETQLYLDGNIRPATGYSDDWVIKQGALYFRSDRAETHINPESFPAVHTQLLWKRPGRVPWQYFIEYDHESKDVATKIVETLQKAARELGIEQFVEIELKESKP